MNTSEGKGPFSKAYLREYKKKIRQLPLEELYDILEQIEWHPINKDRTPERVNIVKKRIHDLEWMRNETEKRDRHAEVEKRFKERQNTYVILLDAITYACIFATLIYTTADHFDIHKMSLFLGSGLFAEAASATISGGITIKGGTIYKEENPYLFKILVILFLVAGPCFLVYGISGILGNSIF